MKIDRSSGRREAGLRIQSLDGRGIRFVREKSDSGESDSFDWGKSSLPCWENPIRYKSLDVGGIRFINKSLDVGGIRFVREKSAP